MMTRGGGGGGEGCSTQPSGYPELKTLHLMTEKLKDSIILITNVCKSVQIYDLKGGGFRHGKKLKREAGCSEF